MREMNRREFLGWSAAGLIGASFSWTVMAREVWSSGMEKPKIGLPVGTIDCHMHIYDDRFPSAPGTTLRPPNASMEQYRAVQKRLGIHRNVVVTPSTYGTDNSCTLDALKRFGNDARGVAVVDTSVTKQQLVEMHDAGVRAIRFNLSYPGATTVDMLVPLASRIAPFGWHIELVVQGAKLPSLETALSGLPCPLVIDHIAHVPQPGGLESDAMRTARAGSWIAATPGSRCRVRMSIRRAARPRMPMSRRSRRLSSTWRPSACSGARTGRIRLRSRRSPTTRTSSM
ncbi:putative TIM-barrel fold metal-dependent hydrolase [Paraburkholderia sp. JPY419]